MTQLDDKTQAWVDGQRASSLLDIPASLVGAPERLAALAAEQRADQPAQITVPKVDRSRGISKGARNAAAMAIAGAVRGGADTLGKLRKALPQFAEKELVLGLKAAVREHLILQDGKRYTANE